MTSRTDRPVRSLGKPIAASSLSFAAVAALVLWQPVDAIGWTPCLALGAGALVLCIVVYVQVTRTSRDDLRNASLDRLEASLWDVDTDYLALLGNTNPVVVEYLRITAKRDLDAFAAAWPLIESTFFDLEFAARRRTDAHRGRPLTMDFCGKQSLIAELQRRRSSARPAANANGRSADE